MTEITRMLLPESHRLYADGNYKKTSITIHSTANEKSTALDERRWLDNQGNTADASWHYCIDENDIVKALPDSMGAWHCGNSEGNRYSLSIEIAESGDRRKTLEKAAEFTAKKLKALGLGAEALKTHNDWSGKNCPRILIDERYIKDGLDWEYFKDEVKRNMKEERFNRADEVPVWGRESIKRFVDRGIFADENQLDLSLDMVRILVLLDRLGI